jgi:hypothetical protein
MIIRMDALGPTFDGIRRGEVLTTEQPVGCDPPTESPGADIHRVEQLAECLDAQHFQLPCVREFFYCGGSESP